MSRRRSDKVRDRDRPVGRQAAKIPDRERPVGRQASSDAPSTAVEPPVDAHGPLPGQRLIVASWVGTAVLALTVVGGLVALDTLAPAVVAVSAAMFVLGSVAFFVAYARAVGRSRHELIGIGGLYFMAGTAPRRVRRLMMGSLAVQVALVLAAVVVRPFSSLVFTSLAPVFGLGLAGWWTSRHGTFASKGGRSD